ncbi:MAG: 50S ribosomal protein L21e [Candidatus Diapherotrites archaeon]
MTNKKARGKRSNSRKKMRKRGSKTTVNKLLQEIETGKKVHIKIDGSNHSGLPPTRYQGLSGEVKGKRGSAYIVDVKKGNLDRELIIGPAHLEVAATGKKEVIE